MRHSSHRQLSLANENAKNIQPIECCTVLYLVWEWFVLVLPKENHQVEVYGHQIALLQKKSLKFISRFRWAQNLERQSLFDCLLRTPKESLLLQLTCYPVTSCGGCLESRGAKKSEERGRGETRKYKDPLPFLFVVCWFSPLLQCFLVFAFSPRELQPFLCKKLTVQLISLFCAATFRKLCYDLTESRSLCWVGELVIWPSGTFATSQFVAQGERWKSLIKLWCRITWWWVSVGAKFT